ncbi:hypothetical protein K1719_029016 [Acacia pycnantha]|nr:hypothetical protein K1719_029016 [Acacia pycnantha]
MENHMNANGNTHPTTVQLKLGSPANVQQGQALVGRLETDKNLNKGVVISMIKKGWGLDKGMELHDEMPGKNTFLFRFTKQEDYVWVLKGRPWSILGTLLNLQHWDDYTILSEVDFDWCTFWIQFLGLPHAAFNCENAIILGNTVGSLVMYESPRLQSKLSRTFVRTGVKVNIREPLLTGFWVPRPQRKPIWVSIRYERLLNYCYDCGCVGNEARNCKFLLDNAEVEETVVRYGNGLGIPHVKTIEEALVMHDQNWDEAVLLWDKLPAAAAGQPFNTQAFGVFPKDGNERDLADKSGLSPPHPPIQIKALVNIQDPILVINQSEPRIMEFPSCVTPTVQNPPSVPHAMQHSTNKRITEKDITDSAVLRVTDVENGTAFNSGISTGCINSESMVFDPPHLTGPTNFPLQPFLLAGNPYKSAEVINNPSQPLYPQPTAHVIATSPESASLIKNTCYLVESPPSVPESTANITSYAGLYHSRRSPQV